VPTAILREPRVLPAQKRHYLLAKLGGPRLAAEYNALAPEEMRAEALPELANPLDDLLTASLKYVLDHADYETTDRVISALFGRYFDEAEEFRAIYLSRQEMAELMAAGVEVGTHGHGHRWLARLYYQDQEAELRRSVEVYTEVFGRHPDFMSYPFGSYNLFTRRLARKHGFRAAVTTRKHANEGLDNPLELGRYDCVDVYPLGAL
jgi:hypothetical protein